MSDSSGKKIHITAGVNLCSDGCCLLVELVDKSGEELTFEGIEVSFEGILEAFRAKGLPAKDKPDPTPPKKKGHLNAVH